jgi:hypothetical protein
MLFTSLGLLPSSVIGETAATDPAYLLGLAAISIVVATRGVMIWHQESGPRWKESFDRVRSPRDWSLTRREWALLTGGYLLLAVANYREALAIARVAG